MKRLLVPQFILVSILLWLKIAANTHGYHIILLWVVCVLFLYLAIFAYVWDYKKLAWILGITAVIHNPILLITANSEICETFKLVTLVLVIPLSLLIKYQRPQKLNYVDSRGFLKNL
jgi:hypothetical protein